MFRRRVLGGDSGFDGEAGQLFMDSRSIGFQHQRKQDGIGQAVRDIVFPAEGMGYRMDIADIRFGKGASGVKEAFIIFRRASISPPSV